MRRKLSLTLLATFALAIGIGSYGIFTSSSNTSSVTQVAGPPTADW